jgi:exopolysaccharide biosynthesis operon protein EpsL
MRNFLIPLLALTATATAVTAYAQALPDTPLTLRASYSQQSDSNLFRLPSGANVQAVTGRSSASEQIGVTTVGATLATTQGLQHFELDVSLVDNHYQNYDYLSFTATNYQAAWRWALTPRLTGDLTASRRETLNSFADYQGFSQRNKRVDTSNRLDAVYELSGPWRAVGGLSQSAVRNEQLVVASGDVDQTASDLGLRYVFSSGSTIDFGGRATSGSYGKLSVPNASLFDDSFKQTDAFLKLHWLFSGATVLDASLSQVDRKHGTYGQRDYSGLNSNAVLSWAITGKTRLRAELARELGVYATTNANYTQTDRMAVGGTWAVAPKVVVNLSHTYAQIDYLGNPGLLPASQRHDSTNDTALSLSWEPVQRLNIGAALQNVSRSSNAAGQDYSAVVASLSAQYSF